MESLANTSGEQLAMRPRALKAAYVLAGTRHVGSLPNASIQRRLGGELCPRLVPTDVFAPVPGQLPGGHPA